MKNLKYNYIHLYQRRKLYKTKKKQKNSTQNCLKQKLWKSDRTLSSIAKTATIDMVTSCYHFVTTNANFSKSSPNICEFLGPGGILKKIIGRESDSMDIVNKQVTLACVSPQVMLYGYTKLEE